MERNKQRALSSRLFSALRAMAMISFAMFLSVNLAFAQDKVKITGSIVDGSGEPLGFTNVVEEGTTNGVASDMDGNFSIEVSKGATLKFTQLGYREYSFVANKSQNLKVEMEEDSELLDELDVEVNVGYGTQKKSLVTGAIASVSSKDITSTSVSRVDDALNGRTAGVQVVSTSGQPGAGSSIIIRGMGSTTNSSPVFVVDGVKVNNIDYLNPGDVESMEVLKDAASAAIYGSNAANGVVLITTKGGKKGEKAKIEYEGYHGWQNPWNRQDVCNADQYKQVYHMREIANGVKEKNWVDFTGHDTNTDWQDEIYSKNAMITSHQLSVTGGSEKTSFLASGSYFKQNGVIGGNQGNSYYERISSRISIDSDVKKWLKVGGNVIFSYSNSKSLGTSGSYSPLGMALQASPLWSPLATEEQSKNYPQSANKNEDGVAYNSFDGEFLGTSEIWNPMIQITEPIQLFKQDYLNGTMFLEFKFLPCLKLRSSINYEMEWKRWNSYSDGYFMNATNKNPTTSASASTNRYGKWTQDNVLTFDKTFKEAHHLTAMIGSSIEEWKSVGTGSSRTSLYMIPDGNHAWVDNGVDSNGEQRGSGGYSDEAGVSGFARVNYDYKGRYLFTATFRADGSSKFVGKNVFGYFPSVSAGWVITNENFMQNVTNKGIINFLRLRASWGRNGNKNIWGSYPTIASISTVPTYYFGKTATMANGAVTEKMPNPDLKWETSEQVDVALDMRFLKNRLNVTVDYYLKKTIGQLASEKIPGVGAQGVRTDWAYPAVNQGTIQNTGVEFTIGWNDKVGDFRYDIGVNGSFNKNKMIEIASEDGIIWGGTSNLDGDVLTRCEEGKSAWYFYGYETDGIFQTQEQADKWVRNMQNIRFKAAKADGSNVYVANYSTVDEVLAFIEANKSVRIKVTDTDPDVIAQKQAIIAEREGLKTITGLSGNSFYGYTKLAAGDLIFVDQNGDGVIDADDRTEIGTPYAKFQLGANLNFEYKGFDLAIQGYGRFGQKIFNGTYRANKYNSANCSTQYLDAWTAENPSKTMPSLKTQNWQRFTSAVLENGSFFRIRSIQLGYTFPKKWMSKAYIENLRLYVAVDNPWCFTKYKGADPEVASNGAGMDFGSYPLARTVRVGGSIAF